MGDPAQTARDICAQLRHHGHRALFAGGCVRDQLLGNTPRDYDIATSALPTEITALFPKTIPVGAAFGVIIVLQEGVHTEVATFRKDGPYLDGRRPSQVTFVDELEDARRRDFTINAMFYDPETDQVLDYVDGQEDLKRGVIRCVGDPGSRFSEDHLRLLRAVRFAARLDYVLDEATRAAILRDGEKLTLTSPERVREELVKLLTEGYAARGLSLLDSTGLLKHILPEIAAMKGVEQPPEFHPEGDVFVHTCLLMQHLPGPPCSSTLAFGALLHDVGKPLTQTFEDRIRFNHHDKVGAELTQAICQRLRFSNQDTARIVWLVAQHMRLASIPAMKESKRKRFIREDGFDELRELCRLDCLASAGNLDTIDWITSYQASLTPDVIHPAPLLTGRDLIAMGYSPGPRFKEVLRAVEDAQLEGEISNLQEARKLVTTLFITS